MDAKTKKKLMDALAAMVAAAPPPVAPVADDDFLFVPFYDKNRPHPDPLSTATGNRIQFDNYSRGQRPGRPTIDSTPLRQNPFLDYVKRSFDPTTMPPLYPTLKRRGLIVELTLPDSTPARCVYELAARIPWKRLDDYRTEFHVNYRGTAEEILLVYFGSINEECEPEVDPHAPLELFIEYVGACRSRPGSSRNVWGQQARTCNYCGGSGLNHRPLLSCMHCGGQGRITQSAKTEAYASAWVDGGWNVRLPESVLKRFFGEPEAKFDGDFHKHLLAAPDITKAYKQLARQFHPDLNKAKDATTQFRKLREAFDQLRDPMSRKRYEAGLKFQLAAKGVEKEVVFRVPRSCGRVLVRGTYTGDDADDGETVWYMPSGGSTYGSQSRNRGTTSPRRLNVTEILRWDSIFDDRGREMVATWHVGNGASWKQQSGEKPFTVEFVDNVEFEVNI